MTPPISTVSATASPALAGTATNQTTSTSGTSSANLLDPQAFLRLLVTQLQYQDPTSPADTSTFLNQTAMLSQVQTMDSMTSTLTALTAAQQAQAATGLIGKHVTYTDSTGAQGSGVVTAASLSPSGATVKVGGATVALANVQEVTAAAS
jgi:flagellar basal-body rod modification protein FlgD